MCYFCTFFLSSFYYHYLAFILTQHLKTSVRKDPNASEATKSNRIYSLQGTKKKKKKVQSQIFLPSFLFMLLKTLLPNVLLILMLWSCILVIQFLAVSFHVS